MVLTIIGFWLFYLYLLAINCLFFTYLFCLVLVRVLSKRLRRLNNKIIKGTIYGAMTQLVTEAVQGTKKLNCSMV